jgi:hypothetical protein
LAPPLDEEAPARRARLELLAHLAGERDHPPEDLRPDTREPGVDVELPARTPAEPDLLWPGQGPLSCRVELLEAGLDLTLELLESLPGEAAADHLTLHAERLGLERDETEIVSPGLHFTLAEHAEVLLEEDQDSREPVLRRRADPPGQSGPDACIWSLAQQQVALEGFLPDGLIRADQRDRRVINPVP